jgi:hypothetical protein
VEGSCIDAMSMASVSGRRCPHRNGSATIDGTRRRRERCGHRRPRRPHRLGPALSIKPASLADKAGVSARSG